MYYVVVIPKTAKSELCMRTFFPGSVEKMGFGCFSNCGSQV